MRPSHLSLLVVSCCVFLVTATMSAEEGDVSGHPMIGEQAPPFELTTTTGETSSLEDLRGKFVVLHFGTSW